MANIRKSFNFRSGLQVDNDNFYVNPNGLVGIGTSIPTEAIDAIGNVKISGLTTTSTLGVAETANFYGDLKVGTAITMSGGIITAVSFYGDGSTLSNVVAISTTGWIPQGVGLHTLSRSIGIGTTNPVYKLQVGLDPETGIGVGITAGNIRASGVITATTFVGNLTGTATTATNLSNAANITEGTISDTRLPNIITSDIDSSGISTFTILKVGTAITMSGGIITATTFSGDLTGNVSGNVNASGVITATTGLNVGTDFNVLSSGRVGIGTELPTSELQIRKSSGSLLEVVSDSGQSRISIGQSVGVGNSTAVLRFGNSDKSFDIINRDTGNINFYLHSGTGVGNTGDYRWYYGKNLGSPLMSLTYGGNLGLGKTNPDNTLHVVGTSTVTSTAYFGGDVRAKKIYFTEIENGGIVKSNTNITSGISTFYDVEISNSLGIGTDILGTNKFKIKDGLESNLGTKVSTGTATVGDTNYFASNLGADGAELKVYGNSYVGSDLYVRGSFYGINASGVSTFTTSDTVNQPWPTSSGDGTAIRIKATTLSSYDSTGNGSVSSTDTSYHLQGRFPANVSIANTLGTAGINFSDGDISREVASLTQYSGSFALFTRNSTYDYSDNFIWASPYNGIQVGYSTLGGLGGGAGFTINKTSNNGNGSITQILRIDAGSDDLIFSGQNVGIGSDNPTEKLDVNGNVKVSGITTSTGGFTSGGPAVEISVTGSTLTFTVPGVGSTSLNLI